MSPDVQHASLHRQKPCHEIRAAERRPPREMHIAVDDERTALLRKYLALDQRCGERVALKADVNTLLARRVVPVERWIAEEDAQLALSRKRGIERAHGPEELLVHRDVPRTVRYRRVLPCESQLLVRHRFAADESIHDGLVCGATGFDDDVVDGSSEARIADQREPELIALLVVVPAFTERDDVVRAEGVDDGGDRFERCGRFRLRTHADCDEGDDGNRQWSGHWRTTA